MRTPSLNKKWLFSTAILGALWFGFILFDSYQYIFTKTSAVIVAFLIFFAMLFGQWGSKEHWQKALNEPVLWAFLGYLFLTFFTSVYILGNHTLEEYLPHTLNHLALLLGALWLYVRLQSDESFLDNFAKIIFWSSWFYLALLMTTMYNNFHYVAILERIFHNPRSGVYNFIKLIPVLLACRLWLQKDNSNYRASRDWLVYLIFGILFLCAARLLRAFEVVPDVSWFFEPYMLGFYVVLLVIRYFSAHRVNPFYKDIWIWIILGFLVLHWGLINLGYEVFDNSDTEKSARLGIWWRESEAIIFPLLFGFLAMVAFGIRLLLTKSFVTALPYVGIILAIGLIYVFYQSMGDTNTVEGKNEYIWLGGGAWREIRAKCSIMASFNDPFYIESNPMLMNVCDRWMFAYVGQRTNYHSYLVEALHRTGLPGFSLLLLGFILPFIYWLNHAKQKSSWIGLLAVAFSLSCLVALVEEDISGRNMRELFYGLSIYPMVITFAIIKAIQRQHANE